MPKSTKHQVVEYIPTKQVELLAAELKEITGDKIRQFIVDKLGKENLRTADLRNLYVKEFINSNEQRLGITVEKSQISLDGHISLSDATLNFYEKIKNQQRRLEKNRVIETVLVNKTTFYKLIDASKASDLHSVKKTAAPKARKPQGMGISDPVELNKSILKLIQAVPMITQIEIFAILSPGHSESAFNAHMAKLEQQGLITRVASAGKNSGRGHRKSCCLTKKYIDSLNLNEDERQKLMTLHLISTDEVMTTPPLTKEQEIQPGQQPLSELQTLATTKLPQETANLIQQERILISHIANFPGILRSELAEKEELLMSATKIRISLNKLEEKQIIRYVKNISQAGRRGEKTKIYLDNAYFAYCLSNNSSQNDIKKLMQEHFVAEDEVKQYLTKLPTLSPEEQIGNVTKRKSDLRYFERASKRSRPTSTEKTTINNNNQTEASPGTINSPEVLSGWHQHNFLKQSPSGPQLSSNDPNDLTCSDNDESSNLEP